MAELHLQISSCASRTDGAEKLRPKQVQQRIEALSPFDIAVRIKELRQLLVDMNSVKLPVKARQSLLDRVNIEVEDVLGVEAARTQLGAPATDRPQGPPGSCRP